MPSPISVLCLPRKDAPVSQTTTQQVPDFHALVHLIGRHTPAATKEPCPQFAPIELIDNPPDRTTRSIASITFGVIDYDDVPEDDLAVVLARIEDKMPYVLLSSFSHGDPEKTIAALMKNPALGTPAGSAPAAFHAAWGSQQPVAPPRLVRARLVVPFSRPCPAGDWWRVWPHLARALEHGHAKPDAQANLVTMAYYFPRHPLVPFAPPLYHANFAGVPFDMDWALAQPAQEKLRFATDRIANTLGGLPGAAPATYELTRLHLRELVQKKRRSKSAFWLEVCETLTAVIAGEAFPCEGSRKDNHLARACWGIVQVHPGAEPASIAKLFAPSLSAMGSDAPTVEDAMEKLTRFASEADSSRAEGEVAIERVRASRTRDYFKGLNSARDTPYSEDEIARFAEPMGATSMQQLWCLQKGTAYYFYGGKPNGDGTCHEGEYIGPFVKEEMAAAARQVLAPAASAGLVFDKQSGNTQRAKTPAELVVDYGRVFRNVEIDLAADLAYYNPATDTLVEAPCPLRDDIVPTYHAKIDEWLGVYAGKHHYERLLRFSAGLSVLNRPSAALYKDGPKGAGKTFYARAASRLWNKRGPSSLEECMGKFNDAILRNPLVFGDEVAPKDFLGRTRTGELRELIQQRGRTLKRKYLPVAEVRGSIRLILAANNQELLSGEENLTTNDIEAIAERFFYLRVQAEAAAFMADMRKNHGRELDAWHDNDLFAEHLLYLRDTVDLGDETRFLASGEAGELVNTLTTREGVRADVLAWLVGFLKDPSKLAQRGNARRLIRVQGGRLVVNSNVFLEAWDVYPTNAKGRPPRRIATAVAGLSIGDRVHLRDPDGTQTWFRAIDTKFLVTFCHDTDQGTESEIEQRIAALDRPSQRDAGVN